MCFYYLIKYAKIKDCYPTTHTHTHTHRVIGLMSRMLANSRGDRGSNPGRVILKTQKMVLDAALFSIQHYKVMIKSKVEQSRERSVALPYTSVWKLLKREPLGHHRLRLPTLLILLYIYIYIYIYSV